jgi:hypothetical protein
MPYDRGGSRGGSFDHSHHGHDGDGGHHHHRMVYWNGGVYAWGAYPWLYSGPIFTGYVDPWLFGPDDYGYDNGGGSYGNDAAAPYPGYGMNSNAPSPYPAQDAAPADQQPAAPEPTPSRQSYGAAPLRQSTITVIFKDGRPPEQIHNFLLTSTTLTVLDQHYREIPLKDVNIAATEATNRAAGVEFRVPRGR